MIGGVYVIPSIASMIIAGTILKVIGLIEMKFVFMCCNASYSAQLFKNQKLY